ncbi:hypothetical protein MXB_3481 [Myxobolus squamalis]|nr:hypothetical protein MXB_3481 [Myxobolus squamalis]
MSKDFIELTASVLKWGKFIRVISVLNILTLLYSIFCFYQDKLRQKKSSLEEQKIIDDIEW